MSDGLVTVEVPDIGDFEDVPIIEILVSAGDTVAAEDPLVTLESDKATMDVPAPAAGVVKEISVKLGDQGVAGVGVDDARRGQRRCAGRRCAGCGCAGRACTARARARYASRSRARARDARRSRACRARRGRPAGGHR